MNNENTHTFFFIEIMNFYAGVVEHVFIMLHIMDILKWLNG